jgi:hypothetical protein
MSTLAQLRKLVLGETWTLPIGVVLALGIAGIFRAVDGDDGWWKHAGGFVLLGMAALALTASLAGALRAGRK